jgi:hypothetical protein
MNEILKCREFSDKLKDLITEFEIDWAQGVQDNNWPVTLDSLDDWLDQFNSWLSRRDLKE